MKASRKLLTEKQAWEQLARWFSKSVKERKRLIKTYNIFGLCHGISLLGARERISIETKNSLVGQIYYDFNYPMGYVWPKTPRGDAARVRYCRKQIKRLTKVVKRGKK